MSDSGAVSARVEDTAEELADSAGPSAIEGVTSVDCIGGGMGFATKEYRYDPHPGFSASTGCRLSLGKAGSEVG